MNIFSTGKYIALGISAILALGSAFIIPQTTSAQIVLCSESNIEGCVTHRGTGGSNPLVVKQLRQETYDARARATFEAQRIESNTEEKIRTLPTPPVAVIPYPENFKTIGEVEAELAALEEEKNAQALSDEISLLYSEIEENNFSSQFIDIEENKNKESITILDALNIVSGREDGKYFPDEALTRKEAVKISLLISGKRPVISKTSSVKDIDDNDWSVPYIEAAINEKMIYIDTESNFEGEEAVFAEEALALYLNTTNISVQFSNKEFEETFSKYAEYANSVSADSIITQYSPNFKDEIITRGEFAELSLYFLQVLRQEEGYEPSEQLMGPQYSASQKEKNNRTELFPEIFKK